jgi:glycosyltransferase involved in cell wall biosynthesis
MGKVTAVVPTLNEAPHIADCLKSLRWADELIVVDSHSDDDTVKIAKGLADRVELHRFESFAKQKNWCVQRATHRWVLMIDADERVSPELRDEIKQVLSAPDRDGYWIRRKNHFLGKHIRGAGWGRDKVLRLFDREKGHYPERLVHEEVHLRGRSGVLKGQLLHYPYSDLGEYWEKFHRYVRLAAMELKRQGRRGGIAPLVLRPPARFMRMYFVQMGFLDGVHGLLLSGLSAFQVFAKYARLWELTHQDESSARRHGDDLERG